MHCTTYYFYAQAPLSACHQTAKCPFSAYMSTLTTSATYCYAGTHCVADSNYAAISSSTCKVTGSQWIAPVFQFNMLILY